MGVSVPTLQRLEAGDPGVGGVLFPLLVLGAWIVGGLLLTRRHFGWEPRR